MKDIRHTIPPNTHDEITVEEAVVIEAIEEGKSPNSQVVRNVKTFNIPPFPFALSCAIWRIRYGFFLCSLTAGGVSIEWTSSVFSDADEDMFESHLAVLRKEISGKVMPPD